MGSDGEERAPLAAGLENQAEIAHLEIPETAVDQARRAAARSGGEVVPLLNPRMAASRAIPAPVMPPPMISRSRGSAAMEARWAARV